MEFHKTRPARLLLAKMGAEPTGIMTERASALFEKLFSAINERLSRHVARNAPPFT